MRHRLVVIAVFLAVAGAAAVAIAARSSTDATGGPPDIAVVDLNSGHSCVVPLTSDDEPAGIDCDWAHLASSSSTDPSGLPFADDGGPHG